MKTKYLFGMLLSGAMLAACTADDDFSTAQKVKQDVNPSAPVFTVHFEDEDLQNRAIYNMSGTNMDNLSFQTTDLLSLFHGMKYKEGYVSQTGAGYRGYSDSHSGYEVTTYLGMAGWQNAIYKGENEDDANTFTFTTQAMVNQGRAILVYPGDTGFENGLDQNNNGSKAPNITISLDQDEKTKELTPYMSEIINIGAYDKDEDADVAGYGKTYDVALKRVGSTLFLNLALANTPELNKALGVKDIEIKRVEFYAKTGGKKPFTKSIPVKVKTKQGALSGSTQYTEEVKPAAYVAGKAHETWFAASELDLASSDIVTEDKISSSDVTTKDLNNAQVIFTLLPFAENTELKSTDQNGTDEVVVTLYTNYGTVEVSEEDVYDNNLKPWVGRVNGEGENMKITDGLNGIFQKYVWSPQTVKTSMFYNDNETLCENVGAAIERTLNVQMKDQLEMNGLHVKTEAELIDAIKVYQYLHPTAETPVYFYLDGDAKNVFTMTDGTWETMMAAREGKNKNGKGAIYCVPCKDNGEECDAVKLVNTEDDAVEVPELTFGDNTHTNSADIQLDGNWKYTSVTAQNKAKSFGNVGKLVVLDKANLELANLVAGNITSIDVKEGGNVGVTGTVSVYVNINNNGTITIEAGEVLNVDGNAILTNLASNTATTGYDTKGAGVIENSGYLNAINSNGSAAIKNYGVINNNTKAARTMITENSSDNDVVATAFGTKNSGHRIGTINLCQEGENSVAVSIKDATKRGFIKLTVSKKDPKVADFGSFANYIIVAGEYKTIKWEAEVGSDGKVVNSQGLYLPRRVQYIEIAPNMTDVNFEGDFSGGSNINTGKRTGLDALIVPATSEVIISEQATVVMNENSAVLAAGDIWYAGIAHFTHTNATFGISYFGGAKNNADRNGTTMHNYAGNEN